MPHYINKLLIKTFTSVWYCVVDLKTNVIINDKLGGDNTLGCLTIILKVNKYLFYSELN